MTLVASSSRANLRQAPLPGKGRGVQSMFLYYYNDSLNALQPI